VCCALLLLRECLTQQTVGSADSLSSPASNTTRQFATGRNCALNVTARTIHTTSPTSITGNTASRVRLLSPASPTPPYPLVRGTLQSFVVPLCNVRTDGGAVPGLQWFHAGGNCMRDDGFRIINFVFTPPPNVYLYSPPKNQVTFCFSLLLSQPSSEPHFITFPPE
jgi:hypothetical protein